MISYVKDAVVFCGIHTCYMIYLEMNPNTRQTIIRPNEKGDKILSWRSMVEFMITPFKINKPAAKEYWKPKNWDINYPVVMLGTFSVYKCIGL